MTPNCEAKQGEELESYTVTPRSRRGKVLCPAHFGCLDGIPTLNVTYGCIFQCTYCYARGYSQAPKKGEVYLYVNLPNLLEEELLRKRVIPPWVILNTSSDCFQPHPDILRITHEVIRMLLDRGIGISFLTKGIIPEGFFDLFAKFPEKILGQMGLVSFSERYWKGYEPHTPSPEQRLENIRNLKKAGIFPEIRIDPIIPFVTDTEDEVQSLFIRLEALGVKRVTLSYLHLRTAIQRQLMKELSPLYQRIIESCFRTQEWKTVGSSSKTKLLPRPIRERGYERIKEMAERFGITALICQCKNPDLKGDLCVSGRLRTVLKRGKPTQLPLFRC
jgi:DNA repair photolyase